MHISIFMIMLMLGYAVVCLGLFIPDLVVVGLGATIILTLNLHKKLGVDDE